MEHSHGYLSYDNDQQMVWWWQWNTVMDTYLMTMINRWSGGGSGKQSWIRTRTMHKTLKRKVQGNVKKLKEKYSRSIKNMLCHMFNIYGVVGN